ncbi:TPA: hypothetical protein DDW35_09750 [Candidatus Sumerlaeota bacterium]|jgi:hypothetical protein|nr:hypothetical protein [Candidatus Sumerlaeota bacterium]
MKTASPVRKKILKRIKSHEPGWVFAPVDFVGFGSRRAVDTALSRLTEANIICRVIPGLYYIPQQHPIVGLTAPNIDQVVKAYARKHALRVQTTGAEAANMLGLSDQVPAKVVFLIDGRTRRFRLGKLNVTLRRASTRTMSTAGRISGLIIQALRYVGKTHVTKNTIKRLERGLSATYKRQLLKDAAHAPAWIANILRHLGGMQGYGNLAIRDGETPESFL